MKTHSAMYDVYVWLMSRMPISPGQFWQDKEIGTIVRVTSVGPYYVSFVPWRLRFENRTYGKKTFRFRREYFLLLRYRP